MNECVAAVLEPRERVLAGVRCVARSKRYCDRSMFGICASQQVHHVNSIHSQHCFEHDLFKSKQTCSDGVLIGAIAGINNVSLNFGGSPTCQEATFAGSSYYATVRFPQHHYRKVPT